VRARPAADRISAYIGAYDVLDATNFDAVLRHVGDRIELVGQITDVTILNTSGIPPYDFAAKKAIENSSPLNPLPKDFPMATEHVTAMFYYNLEPPTR